MKLDKGNYFKMATYKNQHAKGGYFFKKFKHENSA